MGLNVITSPTTFTGGLTASWDNIITSQPLLSSLAGTEEILISDGIVSKKTTAQAIADLGGGGGSITTSTTPPVSPSAGDLWFNSESGILYVYYDDGNSQQWVAADNSGSGGKVAQVVVASTNVPATTTAIIPIDNTIPQNTEGVEFITVTITPTNASSNLVIEFDAWGSANTAIALVFAFFQDSNANAFYSKLVSITNANFGLPVAGKMIISAGSTTSRTYRMRFGPNTTGTATLLRTNSIGAFFNGTSYANFTVTEILP